MREQKMKKMTSVSQARALLPKCVRCSSSHHPVSPVSSHLLDVNDMSHMRLFPSHSLLVLPRQWHVRIVIGRRQYVGGQLKPGTILFH